jgi:hypothetical protein
MTGDMMEESVNDAKDEEAQLLAIAETWAHVAVQYRDYVPLFLDFWAAASVRGMRSDYAEDLAQMYDEYRGMLVAVIERGMANGRFRQTTDAQAVAYLLVGGMDGLFIQSWLSQPQDIANLVRHAMQTVIDGIRQH